MYLFIKLLSIETQNLPYLPTILHEIKPAVRINAKVESVLPGTCTRKYACKVGFQNSVCNCSQLRINY